MRLSSSLRFIGFIILVWLYVTPVFCGSKYPTVQVSVFGLKPRVESLVLSNLSIKAAEKELKINDDRILNLHHIAPQEITQTLEALGYYHSQVFSFIQKIGKDYQVKYRIVLNQPTLIKSMSVQLKGEGECHPVLRTLAEDPPLEVGMILRHSVYEGYKQTLLNQALHSGFLSAFFERKEIKVNKNQHEAEVVMVLNTGPQYHLGEICFNEPPYKMEFLERYISFKPGCSYSTETLTDFQNNLRETELFRTVRVKPELNRVKDLTVPVTVELDPRPSNRYFGSVGFGTDTGARGMLGWERRRKSYPGHKINTAVRASKYFNQFNARYTIPGKHPATDRLVFGFRITEEKFRDKKLSERGDLTVTKIRRLGEWEGMADLNYRSETDRLLPGLPKSNAHFLIPSLGGSWTHVSQTSPKQLGFHVGVKVRGAAQPVISTTSFCQIEMRLKGIVPLGEDTRLLTRADIGATSARNFDEKIPLSLRYLTGGDQSVRGYGYNSLGPRKMDSFGNLINVGGRYMAVGSIELERTLYKKLSLAAFVDTGNAMNHWGTRLYTGGGLGIRYETPLGPLRFDVATPLTKGVHGLRVHVTFGMDL